MSNCKLIYGKILETYVRVCYTFGMVLVGIIALIRIESLKRGGRHDSVC